MNQEHHHTCRTCGVTVHCTVERCQGIGNPTEHFFECDPCTEETDRHAS